MSSTTTHSDAVAQLKRHESDCGSSEVQVALLTGRINHLNQHLRRFPKDNATKMGIMKLVGRRRKLLRYLKEHSPSTYAHVLKVLGLRK